VCGIIEEVHRGVGVTVPPFSYYCNFSSKMQSPSIRPKCVFPGCTHYIKVSLETLVEITSGLSDIKSSLGAAKT